MQLLHRQTQQSQNPLQQGMWQNMMGMAPGMGAANAGGTGMGGMNANGTGGMTDMSVANGGGGGGGNGMGGGGGMQPNQPLQMNGGNQQMGGLSGQTMMGGNTNGPKLNIKSGEFNPFMPGQAAPNVAAMLNRMGNLSGQQQQVGGQGHSGNGLGGMGGMQSFMQQPQQQQQQQQSMMGMGGAMGGMGGLTMGGGGNGMQGGGGALGGMGGLGVGMNTGNMGGFNTGAAGEYTPAMIQQWMQRNSEGGGGGSS